MINMGDRSLTVAVMCFSSGTGGMERSAVRLADYLSKIADVTLMCKKGSFIEELYSKGGYQFKCSAIGFHSRVFSPAMLYRVRSCMNRRHFNNVIFFGASELKTLYFAFLGHKVNLTVWHGTTKSRPKRDFLHRLVYSRVNHHVALSKHLLNNVRTIVPHSGLAEFRVINPSFCIEDDSNNDTPVKNNSALQLVHVGRVAAGKGQVDAVKACRVLHDAGIPFQLKLLGPVGDAKYADELTQAIAQLPYREKIIVCGFVEDTAIYLKQADILLFPSHGEGMPNAFIEALHYGLPCIAYNNTVFPEYLEMGFHVTLAEDRDLSDLSEKLLNLVSNISLEKEAAQENVRLARKYFNIERELNSWREILV